MLSTHLYVHRKKYIWGVILLILLIGGLYIYLKLSAALHFALQTELLITHDPSQVFLTVPNNTTTQVTIGTSIETFHSCSVQCSYGVEGIYSLRSTEKSLTHTINITTPEYGFGERLYLFKTSCVTIPTTFCPSSGKPTNQTTVIVVNYSLRQAEKMVLARKTEIESTLHAVDDVLSQINYTRVLQALWPMSVIHPDTSDLVTKRNTLIAQWNAQQYTAAADTELSLNNSLFVVPQNDQIISQIQIFNAIKNETAAFLNNESIREFVNYSQEYDPQVYTTRQAVNRLTTILNLSYTTDVDRIHNIMIAAQAYLSDGAKKYLEEKSQSEQSLALATAKLAFIRTPLTGLPNSLCAGVSALRIHDLWVANNSYLLLNDSQMASLNETVNATYLFTIPVDFCTAQTQNVSIDIPSTVEPNPVTIPTRSIPSGINLTQPAARCIIQLANSSQIRCPAPRSPIIFIHGHAFDQSNSPQISMQAFAQIQERLMQDGYVDAGELGTLDEGDSIPAPFTIRSSYYYIKRYGIGDYTFEIDKSERIENYALRLKQIIDDTKRLSGAQNVTIVAHSMGGLVVREYETLFGSDSIDHVITINTPHQGITGPTVRACSLLGAAKECEDMTENSTLLLGLGPIAGRWDVIASTGCQMKLGEGDGVVLLNHATLPGASSFTVLHGSCTDLLGTSLHTSVLESDELYAVLRHLLNSTN